MPRSLHVWRRHPVDPGRVVAFVASPLLQLGDASQQLFDLSGLERWDLAEVLADAGGGSGAGALALDEAAGDVALAFLAISIRGLNPPPMPS